MYEMAGIEFKGTIDLNNVITVAGIALGAWTVWRKSAKVERKIDAVHTQVNGITVQTESDDPDEVVHYPTIRELLQSNQDLLARMVALEEYQHTRNHDIIKLLTKIDARQQLYLGLDDDAGNPTETSREWPHVPATEPSPSPPDRTEDS